TTITPNVWHHAAVTYDGSTWNLYLDGALDRTLAVSGNPTPRFDSIQHAGLATAMTSVGATAGFFAGTLDEARVWNSARSQAHMETAMKREPETARGLSGSWGSRGGSG